MRKQTMTLFLLGALACGGCATRQEKSTDQLIGDLKGTDDRDKLIAARLLPRQKSDAEKVIPAMIEALKDRGSDVRLSAAIGLGMFGDKAREAIPALEALQGDPDARVREAAAKAVTRIDAGAASKVDHHSVAGN
jgi:HEAT repeat protein